MGKDFGGRIIARTSKGDTFTLRGTLNVNPSSISIAAVANQDGSLDRTATNTGYRFELNFADRGVDLDALMKADRFNVTFEEEFSSVTHYYTNAFLVGDPVINRQTGEVTGISGASEKYSKTGG
jgi:hypothetical protein